MIKITELITLVGVEQTSQLIARNLKNRDEHTDIPTYLLGEVIHRTLQGRKLSAIKIMYDFGTTKYVRGHLLASLKYCNRILENIQDAMCVDDLRVVEYCFPADAGFDVKAIKEQYLLNGKRTKV